MRETILGSWKLIVLLALFSWAFISAAGWAAGSDKFTIIVLPDTQNYSESQPDVFKTQTQWIVDSRGALNIVFVLHEGDIVESATRENEWQNARAAMNILDQAVPPVPYGLLPGNHDKSGRDNVYFEKYFGIDAGKDFNVTSFKDYPWWGGQFSKYGPTGNANNYQLFSAGGRDWLVMNLEFMYGLKNDRMDDETTLLEEPDDDGLEKEVKAQLRWADAVLKSYPDRMAIITTHGFLSIVDGQPVRRSTGHSSEFVWEYFIAPNPNVFLVMNGHELGNQAEIRRSDYANGRWVHQLLANYQTRANGGQGWLRILEFDTTEEKILVKTYSPLLNKFESDNNSEFILPLPGSAPSGAPSRPENLQVLPNPD